MINNCIWNIVEYRSTVLKYLKSQWHFLIYISVTEALSCLLVSKQITFCVCFERSWLEENLWHFFSYLIWTFGCRSKKTESRKCCTWWKNHSKFIYIYISRSYTWVNVYLSRGCRLKKIGSMKVSDWRFWILQ